MKKLLLVLLIFAVFAGSAFALDFDLMSYPPPVEGGNILVDVGIGFAYFGLDGKMVLPPIFLQGEYALPTLPLSVGIGGSFATRKEEFGLFSSDALMRYTLITFGARANWHWGFDIDWLDLYTGISLGWLMQRVKYEPEALDAWADTMGIKPKNGWFDYGFQVGAHFYFTQNIGAVVEVGFPYLKAGLALKF